MLTTRCLCADCVLPQDAAAVKNADPLIQSGLELAKSISTQGLEGTLGSLMGGDASTIKTKLLPALSAAGIANNANDPGTKCWQCIEC